MRERGGGLHDGRKREHRYSAVRIREWMGGRGERRREKSEVDSAEWDGESGLGGKGCEGIRAEGVRRDRGRKGTGCWGR